MGCRHFLALGAFLLPLAVVVLTTQTAEPVGKSAGKLSGQKIAQPTAASGGRANIPPPTFRFTELTASKHLVVGFDALAGFALEPPEVILSPEGFSIHAPTSVTNQIPAAIRALDGRRVAIRGFMQPLELRSGRVTELMLVRDLSSCCFGQSPALTHWISVRLMNGPVKPILGRTCTVSGTLRVAEIRVQGVLMGLYQLDAERVDDDGEAPPPRTK